MTTVLGRHTSCVGDLGCTFLSTRHQQPAISVRRRQAKLTARQTTLPFMGVEIIVASMQSVFQPSLRSSLLANRLCASPPPDISHWSTCETNALGLSPSHGSRPRDTIQPKPFPRRQATPLLELAWRLLAMPHWMGRQAAFLGPTPKSQLGRDCKEHWSLHWLASFTLCRDIHASLAGGMSPAPTPYLGMY